MISLNIYSNTVFASISGKTTQAIFDAWFILDNFMQEVYQNFQKTINLATMSKKEIESPYLLEYYNCKPFHHEYSGGINHVVSRMTNMLTYAMNKCERLLRFIIMILDADIVKDDWTGKSQ